MIRIEIVHKLTPLWCVRFIPRNPSEMPLVPVMPVPVPVLVVSVLVVSVLVPVPVPVPVPTPDPTPESNWDVAPVRPDRAPDAVVPS